MKKSAKIRAALHGGMNTKHNPAVVNHLNNRTGWIKGKLTPEQKKSLRKFLVSGR